MITTKGTAYTLQLYEIVREKRNGVFRAWTIPNELEQWWGTNVFQTNIEEMDVQVGGRFTFILQAHDGQEHVVTGQYLEISPDEKLVFTWKWERENPVFPTTKVIINFLDQGNYTEMIVTHSHLPNEEAANAHQQGWKTMIRDRLEKHLLTRK